MTRPYLALALAGPHLVELTGSRELLARWDALPVAFTVLGIDRIDGSEPAAVTLASSAAGATLAGATENGRFLIAAAPQRDHPYNLARRVASLAHLSGGRSGLLVGIRDAYAPEGPKDAPAWGGAGLGGGAQLNAKTAYDTAVAVRALEQSWPHDTIIGDLESGILVQSDRIVHVDIANSFSIAGPLNAPVELVLGGAGAMPVVSLEERPPTQGVTGVVLKAGNEQSVRALLDAAERLLADGFEPTPLGGSLRDAIKLVPPQPLPSTVRAAFPAPKPHVAL
jgi:hypothetical protein